MGGQLSMSRPAPPQVKKLQAPEQVKQEEQVDNNRQKLIQDLKQKKEKLQKELNEVNEQLSELNVENFGNVSSFGDNLFPNNVRDIYELTYIN